MIHFIYFNSCLFHHRVYYELRMVCSPVGLISSMYSVASGSRKGQNSIPDQAMTKHDLRSKNIQLYLYPPFEIWFISYISIHVFSTIGYITNSEWFALQLAWLAQCIALRLDIAKVRIRFPIKPEFFQVLFQPPRLFMVLWRSCSLSYLYLQFKL